MHRDAAALTHDVLRAALSRGVFPAACAEVGDSQRPLWTVCLGQVDGAPGSVPVAVDTVFDLASLTKPLATTRVALHLAAAQRLSLDDTVARWIPQWRGVDRDDVTLSDLLAHASGLEARLSSVPGRGEEACISAICAQPLAYAPRSRSLYSDLGFLLLGFIVQRAGEATLEALCRRTWPGANDGSAAGVGFQLPAPRSVASTRPLTDDDRGLSLLTAVVHDTYAARLGGMAGHAGLFGTATGVGALAREWLIAVRHDDAPLPVAERDLLRRAARVCGIPGSSRGLGWDTMLPTSSCGARLHRAAFGHVGFTGTSLWIDPARDRYYVLLSNRVRGAASSDEMQAVRRQFHDAAADL